MKTVRSFIAALLLAVTFSTAKAQTVELPDISTLEDSCFTTVTLTDAMNGKYKLSAFLGEKINQEIDVITELAKAASVSDPQIGTSLFNHGIYNDMLSIQDSAYDEGDQIAVQIDTATNSIRFGQSFINGSGYSVAGGSFKFYFDKTANSYFVEGSFSVREYLVTRGVPGRSSYHQIRKALIRIENYLRLIIADGSKKSKKKS